MAVLQIAHGVTEYIERYEEFANYFTGKGFVVVGNDHLGHGKSVAPRAEPMFFGPEGSWKWAAEDIGSCRERMQEKYGKLPYCLLGFSLGSFLVRTYLIDHPGTVDAVILAGTGQIPLSQIAFARMIAKHEAKKVGEAHTSPLIKKLTFGTYNRRFAPNRTDYDWLCAGEAGLKEYIADPARGQHFTAGLFRELLGGMAYSSWIENIRKMDKKTPVYLISGGDDSVGDFGKGVKKTYVAFRKVGVRDVTMKLYPGLRHDIFHEDCHEAIRENVYRWIEESCRL